MRDDQPVKILLTYDVPDELQEMYYRFVTGEFVPQVNRVGLELAEVWETIYGEYPQRLVVFVAQDEQTANDAIGTEPFKRLEKKLQRYVQNYSRRVVPYERHFQF